MHFQTAGSSLSGLANSNRDMDPIAGQFGHSFCHLFLLGVEYFYFFLKYNSSYFLIALIHKHN